MCVGGMHIILILRSESQVEVGLGCTITLCLQKRNQRKASSPWSPTALVHCPSLFLSQTTRLEGGSYRYPQSLGKYQGRKTLQTHYVTETITGSSHSFYGTTLSLRSSLLHLVPLACPGCICPLFSLRQFLHSHLSL